MKRTRPKQIVIRMNDQEYEVVKRKVEESGKKQQEYLIQALTERQIVNTEGVRELIPELKRIGNNLNQIARSCNEGNQATHEEVHQIGEELNEVWRLLRQLIRGQASDEP